MKDALPISRQLSRAALLCWCWSLVACDDGTQSPPTAPPEKAWTTTSAGGLYSVAIRPESGTPPIGVFHEWRVRVSDSEGDAVFPATIHLSGGMPAHGHGLPTQPQVTAHLGDGEYRIEGMRFNMAGAWVLQFMIDAPAGRDEASFELDLVF